jgi:hypothetical protein
MKSVSIVRQLATMTRNPYGMDAHRIPDRNTGAYLSSRKARSEALSVARLRR